MAQASLTQQQAQELFKVSGFLLLQDLPERTEITIDGDKQVYVTNAEFQGIKLLPSGWHCVAWSVPGIEAGTPSFMGQSAVKHVYLRWFDRGEVLVRRLDRFKEELVLIEASGNMDRRSSRKTRSTSLQPAPTIVSRDLLEGLDSKLLPYPQDSHRQWKQVTRNLSINEGRIGKQIVAKVVGLALESGDALLDTMTPETSNNDGTNPKGDDVSSHEGNLGRTERGKRIWGKSRLEESYEPLTEDTEDEQDNAPLRKRKRDDEAAIDADNDGSLRFTSINLRRSWPATALGPEITRWARDKSWLLDQSMHRAYLGVTESDRIGAAHHTALLCELELAFMLFRASGNACCYEQWKRIITLFCRSSSCMGAGSEWQPHPSLIDQQDPQNMGNLEAHTDFLHVLGGQLGLLDSEFWANQSNTKEETELMKDIESLRANIGLALARRAATARSAQASQPSAEIEVHNLIGAWRSLSHIVSAKFGWSLDQKLDEEVEVEHDLEAESGDDAPVIVEL